MNKLCSQMASKWGHRQTVPCDPLTTIPSSANTATQVTSLLWPVNVDFGVGCSIPEKRKEDNQIF